MKNPLLAAYDILPTPIFVYVVVDTSVAPPLLVHVLTKGSRTAGRAWIKERMYGGAHLRVRRAKLTIYPS